MILRRLREFNSGLLAGVDGADLLWERAAELKIAPDGECSANKYCRLLTCADGRLAVNLARPEDWSLLPAWLQQQPVTDWSELATLVAMRQTAQLRDRGRLMGLAVAAPDETLGCNYQDEFSRAATAGEARPLVVDLSALWAGPLCTHILSGCGFEVIKVESMQRPDGAREGSPILFSALQSGKASQRFDFANPADITRLRQLLVRADIVVEGSRPRALRELALDHAGIEALAAVAGRPKKLWLSLTAYGRALPFGNWIGFGDDVAIAAGALERADSSLGFTGDAVADPLTGLLAALVILSLRQRQQFGLVDFSLFRATRFCVEWLKHHDGQAVAPMKRPRLRC